MGAREGLFLRGSNGVRARSLASLVMTVVLSVACAAQRPLAGEWVLDKSRSELSGRMRSNAAAIGQTLRIFADTSLVCVVTSTTGGPLGNNETTERIVMDTLGQTFRPYERVDSRASSGTRSAQWKPDALQLVVK